MDYIEVGRAIYETSRRIEDGVNVLYKKSKAYAESEREYRLALGKEIMQLKAEGLQATLILDVARGNVSELKFKRDLAEGEYKTCRDMINGLMSEVSALQTLYKRQEEL